jgi:hypothetical protein
MLMALTAGRLLALRVVGPGSAALLQGHQQRLAVVVAPGAAAGSSRSSKRAAPRCVVCAARLVT